MTDFWGIITCGASKGADDESSWNVVTQPSSSSSSGNSKSKTTTPPDAVQKSWLQQQTEQETDEKKSAAYNLVNRKLVDAAQKRRKERVVDKDTKQDILDMKRLAVEGEAYRKTKEEEFVEQKRVAAATQQQQQQDSRKLAARDDSDSSFVLMDLSFGFVGYVASFFSETKPAHDDADDGSMRQDWRLAPKEDQLAFERLLGTEGLEAVVFLPSKTKGKGGVSKARRATIKCNRGSCIFSFTFKPSASSSSSSSASGVHESSTWGVV